MSKTKQVYKNSESQIIIYDLERTDSGKFKCTADNQVGEPQSKEANVVVKCEFKIELKRWIQHLDLMLVIKIIDYASRHDIVYRNTSKSVLAKE